MPATFNGAVRISGSQVSRLAALAAAVAVLIMAVQAPGWLAARVHAKAADVVPSRVYDPWLWQATVGQQPAGPASLVFFTSHTRYFESTGVLVGRDGGYRLIPINVGEAHGLLSPDGRHYLRPSPDGLLDLRTGKERPMPPPGVRPLAWAPDGKLVLGTRDNDDAVITYGPDNEQLNDPSKPDDLLAVDPWTGAERVVPVGTFASHATAAWSPDGALVAVAGPADPDAETTERHRLVVADPTTGTVRWQVDLGERRTLAGRGAFTPDGRRIALLGYDGCGTVCGTEEEVSRSWRIEFLDAATGRPVGDRVPLDGWPVEVVGWRGAEPVVKLQSAERHVEDRHTVLAAVSPGGTRQVLVTSPTGVTDIEVPGDLLTRAAFGGPDPRPSPFNAPPWLYALLILPPLLLAVLLMLRHRRRRSAAAAGPPPPA